MKEATVLTTTEWELVCAALLSLVRDEYPINSLVEIALTWGWRIPPEQVEALRKLEEVQDGLFFSKLIKG